MCCLQFQLGFRAYLLYKKRHRWPNVQIRVNTFLFSNEFGILIVHLFYFSWILRINSTNTARRYCGETYFEDSPLTQRIHLKDPPQSDILLEIDFTEHEFQSNDTFCRGYSELIYDNSTDSFELDSFLSHRDSVLEDKIIGPVVLYDINPQLLKALVGWKV